MRRRNYVCACSKSYLGGKNLPLTPVLFISTTRYSSFSTTKKKRSLRNGKLKANRASATEVQRLKAEERKAEGKMRKYEPQETAPGHSQQ